MKNNSKRYPQFRILITYKKQFLIIRYSKTLNICQINEYIDYDRMFILMSD
jgi:hypothetical protein